MERTVNILGISGSLREASLNTALLRTAQAIAVNEGMAIDITRLNGLPLYNEDDEKLGVPRSVVEFQAKVREADAVLFATPEYNFSIPGVLKNAIDWLSRPPEQTITSGKPVAIMGAGGRLGTARAQYHLRQVCGCLSMNTVLRPEIFVINAWEKLSPDGAIDDQTLKSQISDMLRALKALVLNLRAYD
jgi:chromate reductase